MRATLFTALLVSQIAACDLVYLENLNDHSAVHDLAGMDFSKGSATSNVDLMSLARSSDMSRTSEDLKFSFLPVYLKSECGANLFGNKVWIDKVSEGAGPGNCHSVFQLNLAQPPGSPTAFASGALVELEVDYLIHRYPESDPESKVYQNIRFRLFNGDGTPPEERAIGVLTGYDVSKFLTGRPERVLFQIPLTQKIYTSLLIDFESNISNKQHDISKLLSDYPAYLIVKSIRQIKTP